MLSILLFFTLSSSAFQVNLTSLYPSLQPYDQGPYLDTSIKTFNILYLTFSNLTHIDIYLNSNYLQSLNSSSTVILTLAAGFNTLSIISDTETDIIIAYSNQTVTNQNVSVSGAICSNFNCGVTTGSQISLTVNVSGYSSRIFSIQARSGYWQNVAVQIQNSFILYAGETYLLLAQGQAAMIYQVYKSLSNNQFVNLTLGSSQFYLQPRFTPSIGTYYVQPKLYFSQSIETIQAYSQGNCNITFSSYLGAFIDFTVPSGSLANITVGFPNDQLTLTVKDGSNINFYYLNFQSMSRDKYLSNLTVYSGQAPVLSTYSDVEVCCNLTQIPTNEAFLTTRNTYTLPDQNYSLTPLTIIAMPDDILSTVFFQNQSYLLSSKEFILSIGNNTQSLVVQAEDPYFSQVYNLSVYMRNNDSSLTGLNIPNLQPSFSPTILTYRAYQSFYTASVAIFANTADPNSVIALNSAQGSISQVSKSNISTVLPFNSLTFTVSLLVYAESPDLTSLYSVTFIKEDVCGNGLRFDVSEQCDDGNLVNGDGCSSTCMVESGWTCSGGSVTSPDFCSQIPNNTNSTQSVCGNNIVEQGEQCDNSSDPLCVNCTLVQSVCGNGVVEVGEECDDGNNVTNDGCTNCKKDSNGDECGDGLRGEFSGEFCDDGNDVAGDGCTNCTVDPGWTCTNTSLLTSYPSVPDTCSQIVNITQNSSGGVANQTDSGNTANQTDNNNKGKNQVTQAAAARWDDFGYIGTASFFLTVLASAAILIGMFYFGEKLGIAVIPGILFPVSIFQVLYCFESSSSQYQEFFKSFGWAQLHFYQPMRLATSRRTMDLLSIESDFTPLFLQNIQYWIFLFGCVLITQLFLAGTLRKASFYRHQKLLYLYFYLFSLIPLTYFSLLSLSNPDFSNAAALISFILSALILLIYSFTFLFLIFVLQKSSILESVIFEHLTSGIHVDKIKVNTHGTNDSVVEPSAPERLSLDEKSYKNEDELTTGRKGLDKTQIKIQSAPVAKCKYGSPSKQGRNYILEVQFRWLGIVQIGGLASVAAVLAVFRGIELAGCCVSVVLLSFTLGVQAYRPVYKYTAYKFVHICVLLFLVLVAGVLLSTSDIILGSAYYFVIIIVTLILGLYLHQFLILMLEWFNSDTEVKEFSISNQDVSISYVRDSIPEEKAPGSATINNISHDISMSVLRE